jgi:hypothetical protein
MVIDKTNSSSNRKMKKNNKNNNNNNSTMVESSVTSSQPAPLITQPVVIASPQAQSLEVSSTLSKNKKKQLQQQLQQQQQQQQQQAKANEIQKQNSRDEDEENELSNGTSSGGSSGSIDAVCVNNDAKRKNSNSSNRRNSNDATVNSQKMIHSDNGTEQTQQRNKFQEINLNLLSDLSDDSNSSSTSSSVSSSQSSPPPPLTSIQLQQQQQQQQQQYAIVMTNTTQPNPANFYQTMASSVTTNPQQLIQQVHPIQTVQPFKNVSSPLGTISTNMQVTSKQQQQQSSTNRKMSTNPTMDVGLEPRKQMLIEQQLKQELEIDLDLDSSPMSSLMTNKQYMMQPQRLDNNAIQTLVCDQTKAHLILDDKEALQVRIKCVFILFR